MAGERHNNGHELNAVLGDYLDRTVVLDTAGHLVYLGTLKGVSKDGFWLEHADIHDCRDGHANKEVYIYEAQREGLRTNRKRIFVMRSVVVSLSALEEVVHEDLEQ